MFRRLQPHDLLSLAPAGRQALANEAQPREHLAHPPGWGQAVASLMGTWLPLGHPRQTWVWSHRGRFLGLVTTRPRSGPSAWEIEWLSLAHPSAEMGSELLEHLSLAAEKAGVERLFLRLPQHSAWIEAAHRTGFTNYTQERFYRRQQLAQAESPPPLPLRPRLPQDELALFRLYCLVTPPSVHQAEGITLREWQENREPPPSKSSQEVVAEKDGSLVGWLRLASWNRAAELAVMAQPPPAGDVEALVRYALALCPPHSTLSCLVPDHQEGLGRLLEDLHFIGTARFLVFARSVASRARQPCLLPVQA